MVLFRPDETDLSCSDNVYEEWCPSSNFFEGEEACDQGLGVGAGGLRM